MTRLINLDGDERHLSIAGMGVFDAYQLKDLDSYKYTKAFLAFWRTAIQKMRGMVKIEDQVKKMGECPSEINMQLDADLDRRGEIYRKAENLFREYKSKGLFNMPLYIAALNAEKNKIVRIQKLVNGREIPVGKKIEDVLFALENDIQSKEALNRYLTKEMFDDVEKTIEAYIINNKRTKN